MADQKLLSKLANVPLAKPDFDALNMTAPVLVQMNPDGKWESQKPANLDEEKLRAVVQYLINSKAVSAAQSYCCQCAEETKNSGAGKSNYIPVILMPICPADQCPFDMECEIQKVKDDEPKQVKKKKDAIAKDADKDKVKIRKPKKRGFVLQRLTDFDLLSQW